MDGSITVRHNIETAHRLFELPGKCEAIHGHSMWVTLEIFGETNSKGILEGLEFGSVKAQFRRYLDNTYDHHLLLNENDPWAYPLSNAVGEVKELPGLVTFEGDPTTENIAQWVANWAGRTFNLPNKVMVQETHVNAATRYYEMGY